MKSYKQYLEETTTQQCPEGKYFCHKEKKCMPIPRGYYVGARGWLTRDNQNENGNSFFDPMLNSARNEILDNIIQ